MPTRWAGSFTVICGVILSLQCYNHFNGTVAVVTAGEGVARSGPFEDAQTVFTVRDGTEWAVQQRHEDWVQVVNAAGKIGWLSLRQVAVLPGA